VTAVVATRSHGSAASALPEGRRINKNEECPRLRLSDLPVKTRRHRDPGQFLGISMALIGSCCHAAEHGAWTSWGPGENLGCVPIYLNCAAFMRFVLGIDCPSMLGPSGR
jgi:hypothetical protein